jgi:hypothetical protein
VRGRLSSLSVSARLVGPAWLSKSGGMFAPLLIIGGALGGLGGQWLPAGDPGLWTRMAMAGMMGGTMRSPVTGMFFTRRISASSVTPAARCATRFRAGPERRQTGIRLALRATFPRFPRHPVFVVINRKWRATAVYLAIVIIRVG